MDGWRPAAEVVAHRGASAYAPEHTLAAYELALLQGASTLEVDVRASADGILFILHDATLLRTAADPRALADLRAAEVEELAPAVRPLRLETAFERFGAPARWLVELKDPCPQTQATASAAITRHGLCERAVIQSFDVTALRRLRCASGRLAVAPLYNAAPRRGSDLDAIARFADAIGVWHGAIDRPLVQRAHARGLTVRAWTANHRADIDRLLAAGVDGVITDVPDVARHAVEAAAYAAA